MNRKKIGLLSGLAALVLSTPSPISDRNISNKEYDNIAQIEEERAIIIPTNEYFVRPGLVKDVEIVVHENIDDLKYGARKVINPAKEKSDQMIVIAKAKELRAKVITELESAEQAKSLMSDMEDFYYGIHGSTDFASRFEKVFVSGLCSDVCSGRTVFKGGGDAVEVANYELAKLSSRILRDQTYFDPKVDYRVKLAGELRKFVKDNGYEVREIDKE